MMVHKHFGDETGSWNNDLILYLFPLDTTEAIKAIPLKLCSSEDWLFWKFSNNGIYSVKSGCQLATRRFNLGVEPNMEHECNAQM